MEVKGGLCFLRRSMSIHYPIGESGQVLTLEQNVLDHFAKWRQLNPKMPEAGGQLFGVVQGQSVKLMRATGPINSDRRGRFFFIADVLRNAEKSERFISLGCTTSGIGTRTLKRSQPRLAPTSHQWPTFSYVQSMI